MRIALISPSGAGTRSGNRHTGLRWAAMLRAAGHRVTLATAWPPDESTGLLLALHARRSYASIRVFADRHPDRPLVVVLTGTDVYRDIRHSREAQEALELAHRLVVLQPMAARELEPRLRRKVRVVVQSSATRLRHSPVRRGFRVCVVGNLREEKDPLRALAALAHLPPEPRFELVQLGAALDARIADQARAGMRRDFRYRWLGSLPHARALGWLASSHAMVISSRMEGGANVVCEAIRIGVPVIASRISGNIGLLGDRYPAYFEPGGERELGALMLRAAADRSFYRGLKRRIARLRAMVAPRSEARNLLAAIRF